MNYDIRNNPLDDSFHSFFERDGVKYYARAKDRYLKVYLRDESYKIYHEKRLANVPMTKERFAKLLGGGNSLLTIK